VKIPQNFTRFRLAKGLSGSKSPPLGRAGPIVGTPLRVPEKQVIEPRPFRHPGGTI
jgi:hypothetical protein